MLIQFYTVIIALIFIFAFLSSLLPHGWSVRSPIVLIEILLLTPVFGRVFGWW